MAVDLENSRSHADDVQRLWNEQPATPDEEEEDWHSFQAKHAQIKARIKARNMDRRPAKAEELKNGERPMPIIDKKEYFFDKPTKLSKQLYHRLETQEMPEKTPPFVKVQKRMLYQFMDASTRHEMQLNKRP